MVFITKFNLDRIIDNYDLEKIDFTDELYFGLIPIEIFNDFEKRQLLALKAFYKNPEGFLKANFMAVNTRDTKAYVVKLGPPAYHFNPNCERLLSNFHNYRLPSEIKRRGNEIIDEFRNWFEENKHLLQERPEEFVQKMKNKWKIENGLKEVSYKNSGRQNFDYFELDEVEGEIDQLLLSFGQFYFHDMMHMKIMKKYLKRAYLLDKLVRPKPFKDTDFTKEEIERVLGEFNNKFRGKLKHLIKEYYRLKHNPKLEFSSSILEKLNFLPCKSCNTYKNIEQANDDGLSSVWKRDKIKEPIIVDLTKEPDIVISEYRGRYILKEWKTYIYLLTGVSPSKLIYKVATFIATKDIIDSKGNIKVKKGEEQPFAY